MSSLVDFFSLYIEAPLHRFLSERASRSLTNTLGTEELTLPCTGMVPPTRARSARPSTWPSFGRFPSCLFARTIIMPWGHRLEASKFHNEVKMLFRLTDTLPHLSSTREVTTFPASRLTAWTSSLSGRPPGSHWSTATRMGPWSTRSRPTDIMDTLCPIQAQATG